jgi:UDP-glucose 4-epimerase
MARAVVTGGCGFIGSHLVERLLLDGQDVTVFDGVPPPPDHRLARGHARYVAGDVRDADRLAQAVQPGVDVVYHLAAVVGVDRYLARPLEVIDINVNGTRNVLAAANRVGARVVVASTSEVFGKNPAVPWREDGDRLLGPTTSARWTYATSKALAEHLTFAYAGEYALPATVVRYFNVYGPRQRPAYVISRSIHRALNGLASIVYDTGRQTRCFTYVADAVGGTVLAAATPAAAGNAINLGNTEETTVGEAVESIAKLAGYDAPIRLVDTAAALGPAYQDLDRRVPDCAKARALLGWRATTGLRDGLAATIAWARANPWWLALPDSGAT